MIGDLVVGEIRAVVAAVQQDRLALTRVAVGKLAAGADTQIIAVHDICEHRAGHIHSRLGGAVVDPVGGRDAADTDRALGDVEGLGAAHERVVGRQTTVDAVFQSERAEDNGLAVRHMAVGNSALPAEGQGFITHQFTDHQISHQYIGGTVVDAGSAQIHGERGDGAGRITDVGDVVVPATVAVQQSDVADSHLLVLQHIAVQIPVDIGVGKGELPAAQAVLQTTVTGIVEQLSFDNHGRAPGSLGAIISPNHVGGADGYGRAVDGAGGIVHVIDQVVVAAIAIFDVHVADRDAFTLTRIGIDKGELAAIEAVTLGERATGGHNGSTRSVQAAVVAANHVGRGEADRGPLHIQGVAAPNQAVVRGQAPMTTVRQCQGPKIHCFVGARVFVIEQTGTGQVQGFIANQCSQRQVTRVHVEGAIVGTATVQVDHERGNVGFRRRLTDDVVVAYIGTLVGALQRDHQAIGHVLVGKLPGRGHLHLVCSEQTIILGASNIDRGVGRAVVHPALGRDTRDDQIDRIDLANVCRQGFGVRQAVTVDRYAILGDGGDFRCHGDSLAAYDVTRSVPKHMAVIKVSGSLQGNRVTIQRAADDKIGLVQDSGIGTVVVPLHRSGQGNRQFWRQAIQQAVAGAQHQPLLRVAVNCVVLLEVRSQAIEVVQLRALGPDSPVTFAGSKCIRALVVDDVAATHQLDVASATGRHRRATGIGQGQITFGGANLNIATR